MDFWPQRAVSRWLPGTEVGWSIAREYCGYGYATEAATATIDWAFANLDWTEVVHVIDVNNAPSQAVARKLGSRNRGRGQLPPPFVDSVIDIWGQTKTEWLSRGWSASEHRPDGSLGRARRRLLQGSLSTCW